MRLKIDIILRLFNGAYSGFIEALKNIQFMHATLIKIFNRRSGNVQPERILQYKFWIFEECRFNTGLIYSTKTQREKICSTSTFYDSLFSNLFLRLNALLNSWFISLSNKNMSWNIKKQQRITCFYFN